MKCFRYVRLNVIYFTFINVLRWLTRKFKITYMIVTSLWLLALDSALHCKGLCILQTLPRILGDSFLEEPDVSGGHSYPALTEGSVILAHCMFLLAVPAEWLFQPPFSSHREPSSDGRCCGGKGEDMVIWAGWVRTGGACISHNHVSAQIRVFFSTKVKKILMVLEAVLCFQF